MVGAIYPPDDLLNDPPRSEIIRCVSKEKSIREANLEASGSTDTNDIESIIGWDGSRDPGNPFNWTLLKKWRITLLACFMTFAVQVNGTAMTSAAGAINEAFSVTDEHFPHSYWPVLSWNLGGAAAPLAALPAMENFGVRWSYIFIHVGLIIFLIPQMLAQNFATMIITRIFSGGCSGVLVNITAGIISDIWRPGKSKSFSTSLWIFSVLTGLSMGPVFGSLTLRYTNWRWIFLSEIIAYTAITPAIYFLLPEIRPDVILTSRAKQIRKETSREVYAAAEKQHLTIQAIIRETLIRPTRMLTNEPVVLFFGLLSAFCIGTAFMFTQSIGQVYGGIYGWTYYETGFIQAAVVVGEIVALAASLLQDRVYFASASRNTEVPGRPIPESRLYFSIPGAFIGLAGGLFIYAWTSYSTTPWIIPTIGLGFVGFGMFTVAAAVSMYIMDSYGKFSASAIAGVTFLENGFAAFLPLATQDLYRSLGFNWASCLLGFIALGLAMIPVVLIIWGRKIRESSHFMREANYDDEDDEY